MEKKLIRSCMEDNQVFKVGDYVVLKDNCTILQKDYDLMNGERVKILNLFFEKESNKKELQFKALVENSNGICEEIDVINLKSINRKKESSITKTCKAYETLKGELKFFIGNVDELRYNNI